MHHLQKYYYVQKHFLKGYLHQELYSYFQLYLPLRLWFQKQNCYSHLLYWLEVLDIQKQSYTPHLLMPQPRRLCQKRYCL